MEKSSRLPSDARSKEVILLEDMKLLGAEKLLEIERNHPFYPQIISHILTEALKTKIEVEKETIKQGEVYGWLTSLLLVDA